MTTGRAFDPSQFPDDLPRPMDDGGADHLWGARMPALALPSTSGGRMRVDRVPANRERLVIYAYPRTGRPGFEPPELWDSIPGARGCTPESCAFRDHAVALGETGAAVAGLSTQTTDYQREATDRLHLPFPLLSDHSLELTHALRLPSFELEPRPGIDDGSNRILLKRLTLVIRQGRIEHVFYPVFPPDRHAEEVLAWLRAMAEAKEAG